MNRLSVKLFLSYLAVVIVSTGVAFITARALAPTFFRVNLEQGRPDDTPGSTLGPGGPGATVDPTGATIPGGSGSGNGTSPTSGSTLGPTGSTRGPGSSQATEPGGSRPGSDGSGSTTGPSSSGGPTTTQRRGSTSSDSGSSDQSRRGDGEAMIGTFAAASRTTLVIDEEVASAFRSAIDNALLVALAVSIIVAMGFSWVVGRRVLQPLARVREAAVRLGQGHYEERVPEPADEELAELARDVNRLAQALEETERRRTQLISDVAHELRTPLTTIQGSMEGLMDGVLEPGDAVYASVAEEAARLQRVVADLSLLSRLDESAFALASEQIDVTDVARAVADRLNPQYQDKGVQLTVSMPSGLMVTGDRDRLAQVFTNLIGNALGHTPKGGSVTIEGGQAAGIVEVRVIDTGEGIAPDELERIFDRFHRATGTKRQGSGLGLTIARSLAEAHGGDVTASSPGRGLGSVFTVRLPHTAGGAASLGHWTSRRR